MVTSTALFAILFALNGCATASQLRDDHCTISSKLVPECGALWGIATQNATIPELDEAQGVAGRKFDFVYRFHDINDPIPDEDEQRLANDGTLLHLSIDPRDFASGDRTTIKWADVANGDYDWSLRAQARGISDLKVPVFVTFDHEVDQPAKSALGSPEDFKAAWRHMHDIFEDEGATNAVWVWVVLGWQPTIDRAVSLWPGNEYVDWISWDVYNASGCRAGAIDPTKYQSFEALMLPFYRWVHAYGDKYGIDAEKPMMISEAGSVRYQQYPEKSAQWYAEIPEVLRKYPQIKAVGLWNSVGNGVCDYRFTEDDTVADGVRNASKQAWVNPLSDKQRPRP